MDPFTIKQNVDALVLEATRGLLYLCDMRGIYIKCTQTLQSKNLKGKAKEF
jgi:hypothetical protein